MIIPGWICVCRVGDVLRFGQSSRLYLYGGPEELMPEEGLTKSQRKQTALIEVQHTQPSFLFCLSIFLVAAESV